MVEQEASSGAQVEEKGPWNVERGAGHLGRVQKRSESMQGCDEEGQGPPGIEAGKGQKQQEGLLQLHQQQKEHEEHVQSSV